MHYFDLYEKQKLKESVEITLPQASNFSEFVTKFKSLLLGISGKEDAQISAIINNLKGFKKDLHDNIDDGVVSRMLNVASQSINPQTFKNYMGQKVTIMAKPRENTLDIRFQ